MPIKHGDKVAIHYTLTNDAGDILDSTQGKAALSYTAGAGEIIPGLDQALLGKEKGEHIDVTIAPADAYGERVEQAIQQVPREHFANIPELAVGLPLTAETPQGPFTVFVTEITDSTVTIDGNHPLAGVTLHFAVDVDNIESGDAGPKIILPN